MGKWTAEGREFYDKWTNFKKYLKDNSLIMEKPPEAVQVWGKFLVYATALGCAEEVTKNMKEYFKAPALTAEATDGEYIYTSDSNYIKNMSDENITVVCSNGNYVLKPNQILIADYNECVNNTRMTFGEKIDDKIEVDELSTKEYIPTKKQEIIQDNIIIF